MTERVEIGDVRGASTPGGRKAQPDTEPATSSVSGLHVVVVDDDRDARELLAVTLESHGAFVRSTSSAAEALDLIAREQAHVLVADIGMPEEDGYTLIRRLRDMERNQRRRRVPAIAVTAYAIASDREQVLAAGFDLHLPKPVDPTALVLAIAGYAAPEA